MSDKEKKQTPQVIRPPSTLQQKVGPPTSRGVDEDALLRAEKVVEDLSESYMTWVKDDLTKLREASRQLAEQPDNGDLIEQVFTVAHAMKGQGGTFGFDLVSHVSNSLYNFVEQKTALDPTEIEVVKVHVDTLFLIIAHEIKGDGGQQGAMLLNGLDQVIAKVSSK